MLPGTLVKIVAGPESDLMTKKKLNGKYGLILKRLQYNENYDGIGGISRYALLVLIGDRKCVLHCRDLEVVSE